ncbi:MAG: FAD-dependent oxidoreductase [Clostridia bacterium]|nr:FAD-dependent oxidoreductase [Clostridia bacterium]
MKTGSVIYNKKIDNVKEYDVAVIGGGPAGVGAAIAAARGGAKTVLIETTGMLGGMATSGLVGPFMTCYDYEAKEQLVRGIFEEIVQRTIAAGGAIHPSEIDAPTHYTSWIDEYHHHVTPFDSTILQTVLDEMVVEAGVKIMFYTKYFDSVVEDKKISYILLANCEGISALKAKVYIDCTGNADVATYSGVPVWFGDDEKNICQPCTLFFEVDGVDSDKYTSFPPYKAYLTNTPGKYKINHTKMYHVDAHNNDSMTQAHIDGRRRVIEMYDSMKKIMPGFENARFVQCADVVGVRESYHIVGKYRVKVKDISENTYFPDAIMTFGYGMDIHSHDGSEKDGFTIKSANWYTIPYRSLIPENCDNLAVAGRCICADSHAAGSFRVMPSCVALGQAAGTGAAMAVKLGVNVGDVPVNEHQKNLISQDVVIKGIKA